MKHIKNSDFKTEVLDFSGVVVADFYADWCGPCQVLSPIMEELDKHNTDQSVKFIKINVDEEQDLAALYGVMSIPTVIFFKDGKIAHQQIGMRAKEEYLDSIKKLTKS